MTVDLLRAVADNHRSWFMAHATSVEHFDGMEVIVSSSSGSLMFPDDPRPDQLDAMMRLGLSRMSCWSLTEDVTLGVRLLARGFEWGWQPWWMARDLAQPIAEPEWEVLADDTHHLTTREGGHVAVHPWQGIAGLYDMGVVESKRRRGIGTSLTLGALHLAKQLGCTWATLNATPMGDPVYRRAGFFQTGKGRTWWLHPGPRPTPEQTRLVEAVGFGELDAITGDLEARIPGAGTPLEVAEVTGREDSAARIRQLLGR